VCPWSSAVATTPPPEPILVPCAGAGARGHALTADAAMCTCCGIVYVTEPAGLIPGHDRQDIIAMIARGDFDQ
jgi:hypothetical protein